MGWSNDPEMQKMFLDEVTERSARLVEGAQALRAGAVSPQEAGDLLREGHTIKGTGRVMGYEDVGSAGLMLEMIWRWIQQGDITPVPLFGRVLEGLSAAIPRAIEDPAELSVAMTAVHEFFDGQELPEELPPAPQVEGATAAATDTSVATVEPVIPGGIPAEGHTAPPEVVTDVVEAEPEPEPVMSAHEMFAQLASEEGQALEDQPMVVSDHVPEVAESESESEPEPVDDVGVADPSVAEPVMSAHEMFAQLASEEGQAVEDQPVVVSDAAEVAEVEPEQPPMELVDGEPGTESTGGDPGDEAGEDAARSAQEAFAELRRSMAQEAAAAEIAAEPEDHPVDDEGTPAHEGAVPRADEESHSDAAEASIGSIIEFPVSEADAEVGQAVDGDAEPDPVAGDESAEATDVVVLPANRRTSQRDAEEKDLGGLIGAVQTWAAEEPISVNTGRLYGLVNNIVSLRMNVEIAKEQLAELAEVAAADPFFADRVSGIASEIEPIAEASELIEGEALGLAAVPLRDVTNTLPQLGRYLSRKTGKELRVEIVGDDVLVDRQVLDRLGDAIRQLVVNSAVHGIEDVDTRLGAGKPGTGSIRIEAKQTDVNLEVSVVDDGRGVDWKGIREKGLALGLLDSSAELAPDALRSLLYRSGFTTRDDADELAGDGDGLAVVRDAMESLNGSLRVESTPKMETRVSIVVPIHQAMQKALLVVAGGIMWGIPETGVLDVVEMNLATIAVSDHTTVLERPDGDVPFASFADLMGQHSEAVPTSIVIATSAAGPVALGVEEVVGVRRVAAKELGAVLADAEAGVVNGAALLGGDQVVLLVDTTRLAEKQREVAVESPSYPTARILIVDDSVGVQQVVSSALATSGFNTSVAASVADALGALQSGSIDAVVVDFSMPRADGVALAHMVRQRHGDLPIVMLSGVAEGEDVDRAREAGVDAFFDKADFREGGLAEKLRELITARREKEQTA